MASALAPRASAGAACARSRTSVVHVTCRAPFSLISRPVFAVEAPTTARPRSALAALEAPASPVPARPSGGGSVVIHGVHHVALICADLEKSLEFYQGVLGLEVNPDRPHDKLPYRGAWLWIGPEMIHLMELPNPDPSDAATRPQHGGRDRHFCIGVADIAPLVAKLDAAGIPFTKSMSGRPAVFFRDPDANVLEAVQGAEPWR
ncbi:MAG: glyoxylase family protein [Monoraphidium minutum]|nr:MAG: glyoxylase family protein [Monoraphidium minutum]